jgi:hypothetical protein
VYSGRHCAHHPRFTGSIEWVLKVHGFESRIANASPGALLFLLGGFISAASLKPEQTSDIEGSVQAGCSGGGGRGARISFASRFSKKAGHEKGPEAAAVRKH